MNQATIYYPSGFEKKITPKNGSVFTLDELQGVVGGYIEFVYTDDDTRHVIVNEEGLITGLPYNTIASLIVRHPLFGNVLICDKDMVE